MPGRAKIEARTFVIKVATTVCLAPALGMLVLPAPQALAAEKRCSCKFVDPSWEAFGTNAACATYTTKAGKSCEIAFGGLGADMERSLPIFMRAAYVVK